MIIHLLTQSDREMIVKQRGKINHYILCNADILLITTAWECDNLVLKLSDSLYYIHCIS